ncbi:MAG: hypothetical protein JHC41_07500 [Nitrosopumilus sp.]|nr:hypothetical protein [Nitrosopumilus sp.]
MPLFFNTVFCIWALIESGTSRGVSWKPKSSRKLVNAFHLPPLLRRHHKIKEWGDLFHKISFFTLVAFLFPIIVDGIVAIKTMVVMI